MSRRDKRPVSSSATFVFQSLKADISLGRLHPRERLVEADLVQRFQSHRPAVREALRMLTDLGLVVHVPNKGASVAELNLEELTRIYEMRIELESIATEWIPLPLSEKAIQEIEAIQEDHSAAVANKRYREIFYFDELFHGKLNSHCGNRHLEEMIDLMSSRGLSVRYSAEMTSEFLEEVRDEHLEIVDAIKRCDRNCLVETMRAHNVRGLDWFSSSRRDRMARIGGPVESVNQSARIRGRNMEARGK